MLRSIKKLSWKVKKLKNSCVIYGINVILHHQNLGINVFSKPLKRGINVFLRLLKYGINVNNYA